MINMNKYKFDSSMYHNYDRLIKSCEDKLKIITS